MLAHCRCCFNKCLYRKNLAHAYTYVPIWWITRQQFKNARIFAISLSTWLSSKRFSQCFTFFAVFMIFLMRQLNLWTHLIQTYSNSNMQKSSFAEQTNKDIYLFFCAMHQIHWNTAVVLSRFIITHSLIPCCDDSIHLFHIHTMLLLFIFSSLTFHWLHWFLFSMRKKNELFSFIFPAFRTFVWVYSVFSFLWWFKQKLSLYFLFFFYFFFELFSRIRRYSPAARTKFPTPRYVFDSTDCRIRRHYLYVSMYTNTYIYYIIIIFQYVYTIRFWNLLPTTPSRISSFKLQLLWIIPKYFFHWNHVNRWIIFWTK